MTINTSPTTITFLLRTFYVAGTKASALTSNLLVHTVYYPYCTNEKTEAYRISQLERMPSLSQVSEHLTSNYSALETNILIINIFIFTIGTKNKDAKASGHTPQED